MERADIDVQSERHVRALGDIETTINLKPGNWESYFKKGGVVIMLKEYKICIKSFEMTQSLENKKNGSLVFVLNATKSLASTLQIEKHKCQQKGIIFGFIVSSIYLLYKYV